MMKVANLAAGVVSILIFSLLACNEGRDSSPYAELLKQAPYGNLTDSIQRAGSRSDLYFRRGQLLAKNEQAEPALADYQKAWSLEKREEYAVAISNLLLDRDPVRATAFIQEALRELPGNLFLQLNLVEAYKQQQKTDEALAVCNEIIEKYPGQIDALISKSELLETKNDPGGSVATLEQAYQLAPFDGELCHNLAFKYAQTKNSKVLPLCDSLIKADSAGTHAEPYYFKGVYYYNIGDKSRALNQFNQSIVHDYYFLDAYLEKGRILYEQRNYSTASQVFQLATTISPAFADAYYWLARCEQATGKKEEAKENYLRAYNFDKTLTAARDSAANL